ncbi:MAG TPA: hypothetical protein VFV92_13705, partial [Candidatus Bathyarchaeia archaeon]|nr:hypothetical protein [Candidatus Bathyarchaeia archaeon]
LLGLPVMRLRPGNRGPVIAYSETLDSWIKSRATGIKHSLSPDIAATLQHAKFICERMMDQHRVLMKNELAAGKMLAKLAERSDNPKVVSRETALARQAYDTIMNLSRRVTVELDQLRDALRKLGGKI